MKLLKSKYHTQGWIDLRGVKYQLRQLPIEDIWPSVEKAEVHRGVRFYDLIKKDISKNGLHFPLLVVKATRKEILFQKNSWKHKILKPPFPAKEVEVEYKEQSGSNAPTLKKLEWVLEDESTADQKHFVCWGGSQRVRIAKDLGYTHIDCAMMPKFKVAHQLQRVLRNPYGQYYK